MRNAVTVHGSAVHSRPETGGGGEGEEEEDSLARYRTKIPNETTTSRRRYGSRLIYAVLCAQQSS